MNKIKTRFIILMIILFPFTIKSQVITKLPNISSCNGNIVIPVVVNNFDSINAITLTINFDSNTIVYLGYEQVHPVVQGIYINNVNNNDTFKSISIVSLKKEHCTNNIIY